MLNDKDYAVIVGVKDYDGLSVLEGPDTDATCFEQWILHAEGGAVPESNCKKIISKKDPVSPMQQDIDFAFGDIFNTLKTKKQTARRLYFYFSGHGLGITWDETALALPSWSDIYRNFAISSTSYLGKLIESGFFEQIFFFLDCCRNRIPGTGGAVPYFSSVKPDARTASCEAMVCYATEFDNPAWEAETGPSSTTSLDNNLVRGFFTVALINGLEGAAADKNGVVSVTGLRDFLKRYLPELASQKGKRQVPRFINTFSNDPAIPAKTFDTTIELNISFAENNGKVVMLEDPELEVIKKDSTLSGPWQFRLKKGRYGIKYDDDSKEGTIRIDGTKNPYNYVF